MRPPALIKSILGEFLADRPHLVLLTSEEGDLFGEGKSSGAILSEEDEALYRYMLWRAWDSNLPVLLVIMLNPSHHGYVNCVRTIETLLTRAKMTGHGSIVVVNLFAWRATSPADMKKVEDPIGKDNDAAIEAVLNAERGTLLCAWGTHGTHLNRSEEVLCRIAQKGRNPVALKISKDGEPEHPLYKKLENGWFPFQPSGSTS